MDEFPLKLNELIDAFVAHNWLAAAIVLAVMNGLAEKCRDTKYFFWIAHVYDIFRDAWKVVRPPSNNGQKKG